MIDLDSGYKMELDEESEQVSEPSPIQKNKNKVKLKPKDTHFYKDPGYFGRKSIIGNPSK